MKKSSTLLIVTAFILSACGSLAQYASSGSGQQYQDGIYNNTPAFRTRGEKEVSKSETQALVEQTKESPIYLFGDKKDTVMIPQDMSATIRYDQKLGGTVVTVGENPYDWRYDLENSWYWYNPYSVRSQWYWSMHYSPWYSWNYGPWGYSGWYSPFYYGPGWYDPWYGPGWYYGGWYDPWYGPGWYYGGWYDPWHHPHHGWYDPYWHHHGPGHGSGHGRDVYFGNRHETGSDRVFTSSSSLRAGMGTRSSVSRSATLNRNETASSSTRSGGTLSGRTTAVRTTPASRKEAVTALRVQGGAALTASPSAVRTAKPAGRHTASSSRVNSVARPAGPQSNYRRPASTVSTTVSRPDNSSGTSSYGRTASSTRQSFGNTSTSTSRSTSSYNRSTSSGGSSASSRSSISSGSGRSSTGGGGFSRSGGSAGGRR